MQYTEHFLHRTDAHLQTIDFIALSVGSTNVTSQLDDCLAQATSQTAHLSGVAVSA
jgi:hypothetical protein